MSSDFKIKFGDLMLSDYFDLTSYPIGRNNKRITNTTSQLANGVEILSSRYEEKMIELKIFSNNRSVREIDDVISQAINQGAQKLVFSDFPNEYYLAKLDGDAAMYRELENKSVVGTLNFIVPDGLSHPDEIKGPYTATQGADGRYSVTVVNEGSVDAPITMTATMNAENGYVGMYTDYAITGIGNKEETDGVDYQQTETFLDTTAFNGAGWSNWSGTYTPDARFDLSGTLGVSGSAGQSGLRLATTGGNKGLFNGGGKIYTLPADSEGAIGAKNFYAWWDTFFWAGKMGQTAVQDIIFWSGNEIIARWLVLKTDKNGNSAVCRASYNDGTGIKNLPKYDFTFKSSHLDTENPFNQSRGAMDFLKEGAKIQFHYWGQYPSVIVPYLADKQVTKVSMVLANYDKRTGDNYVTHNAIQKLQIRKLKVDKWRDVPNRFSDGDIVKMTGADSKVYVNGMPKLTEKADGSNLFSVPPGETTIYFQCSDWCAEPPTYKIEFKEANL
ncbi:distal tail protein Dit [Pseudolactococcus reticulitermitis]|uniref:Phage tail protein n=1 Tax=Pseudolactococcus reticulitermitis TaxID=2025039 RepID=A0A224XCG8_9LACT|nr:distal tail protein Dit [Lactococcus reticulitermitis]GAX47321.1 hypothetical protein RsY01_920 [Lactococcus reticulitermitis]